MEQQHPIFAIYTRDYLHKVTGFSKTHLSRVATGKATLTRSFIARCCITFGRPASDLFLPDTIKALKPKE